MKESIIKHFTEYNLPISWWQYLLGIKLSTSGDIRKYHQKLTWTAAKIGKVPDFIMNLIFQRGLVEDMKIFVAAKEPK